MWFLKPIYSCCGTFFCKYLANLSLAIAQSALSVLSYSFLYLLRQFISLICLLPGLLYFSSLIDRIDDFVISLSELLLLVVLFAFL